MSARRVKLWMRVSPQTAYHLRKIAASEGCDPGRVVDKLVRAWALNRKGESHYDKK